MKLTNPFLTRSRREAIALAAREQINAATARMQRNVYREHGLRMAAAIGELNQALAHHSHTDSSAVQDAIDKAVALAQMARDYDTLQATTDPTIQEN